MTHVAEDEAVRQYLTAHLERLRRDLGNYAVAIGSECTVLEQRQRRIEGLKRFLAQRPEAAEGEVSIESIVKAKIEELRLENERDGRLRDSMAERNQERAVEVAVLEAFLSEG